MEKIEFDVRALRNGLGLSQEQFADRLEVHQATVSRWERGELPLDKRTRLAMIAIAAPACESAAQ